jgi:HemY protein
MRLILFVLAILLLAILGALFAIDDPGYVLIARAPWSIEMALTLFLPLLLGVFFALFVALYIVARLIRIPRDVQRWRHRRQERQSRRALLNGFKHLAEGNWSEAETALMLSQRHSESPLLSHLGAACAAQAQGLVGKRDEYLAQAHKHAPADTLAIGLVQAYLQHLAHQDEQALATLSDLHQQHPKHPYVLKLLARVHRELRDWTALAELLPSLRRHSALSPAELDELELIMHRELLMLSLPSGSLDVLQRAWNALPRNLRHHPTLIGIYARQLMQQEQWPLAETTLRQALDNAWDDSLVELYGRLTGGDLGEALETAEGWLVTHPDHPRLLLTLGRLARRAAQPVKARGYLEKAVQASPTTEACLELGAVLEEQGETARALAAYRRGLESCGERSRPPLPRGVRISTLGGFRRI